MAGASEQGICVILLSRFTRRGLALLGRGGLWYPFQSDPASPCARGTFGKTSGEAPCGNRPLGAPSAVFIAAVRHDLSEVRQ
jgi:hypothetical protein